MDVVIPLGIGSRWDNTELRYALRSLEMYCTNLDNVYLVGEKPHWIKNGSVIHIPSSDRQGLQFKESNICLKIIVACTRFSLSPDFLFMNDDHFLLSRIPPVYCYYENHIQDKIINRSSQDSYYNSLFNTMRALDDAGKPTKYFDIHAPIIYNKEKFLSIMAGYDWSIHCGYVIKSLYCNTLGVTGKRYTDLKITSRLPCAEIEKLIDGRKFFSIGDGATGWEMGTFLQYLYKNKSKFEI